MRGFVAFMILVVSISGQAQSPEPQELWQSISTQMSQWQTDERTEGISYILSGTLLTIGSVSGFYSTSDPFGKAVFSTTQVLGLGAVGYGLRKLSLGHELIGTYRVIDSTENLTPAQKAEIFYRYHQYWKKRQRRAEWIEAATYAISGALTLYNATQLEDTPSQNVLYGFSALSFALALHKTF